MIQTFNHQLTGSVDDHYQNGYLPQRNQKGLFYTTNSSRCSLKNLKFSSENRRIFKKTENFSCQVVNLSDFDYTPKVHQILTHWSQELGWDFPSTSIKTVFTRHIFNRLYLWFDNHHQTVGYSVCYFSNQISHIAYVFYDPSLSHHDVPIRMVLEVIKDSADQHLNYTYVGRFDPETKLGFYKRNLPNFEYFTNGSWQKFC